MKRKIIGCSGLLLLVGIGCFPLFNHKTLTPDAQQNSAENEEIIAPAIIDSLNDVSHVPTYQGGIVTKIHVRVGQRVKKGQALLSLDDSSAKYNVLTNEIALKQAKNNLIIQKKNLKYAKARLKRLKSLDQRAYSKADMREKIHDIKMATIQLEQNKMGLKITKENLKNAKITLSEFTTVAPKDGVILQIDAHLNEHIGGLHQAILLGDANKVIVRVSIDERDIKNFSPKASSYLTDLENDKLKIPLTFMQLDGYIITQDRLNSRVQEALYFFNRDDYPSLVAGQQFDAHVVLKTA